MTSTGGSIKLKAIFTPLVAGGAPGALGSECVPLRLDVYATRELKSETQQILITDLSVRVLELELAVQKRRHEHAPGLPFCDANVGLEREYLAFDDGMCALSSAVIVNMYARSYTASGQEIFTSLGAALLPVATLLSIEQRRKVNTFFNVILDRELDSQTQPTTPPIKGTIQVTEVRSTNLVLRSRRRGDIYQDYDCISKANNAMRAMIRRGQDSFFGPKAFLRPTVPILMPYHVPTNQTDFMILPSSAYTMVRPREKLDVPYYENLLRVALRRSRLTEAEAVALAIATRDNTAPRWQRSAFAAFVVRAMSVFALSQCYMDDLCNLNNGRDPWRADLVCSDEDFKLCRLCGGDDCEGCALEPHMHVNQLCDCTDNLSSFSPLLRLVRSYLRAFVPCLALGCVTNKKFGIDQLDQPGASAAHTFAVLIPFTMFERLLTPENRTAVTEDSLFERDRAADIAQWSAGIEQFPLICEATAPIDPAMRSMWNPTGAGQYYASDPASADVATKAVAARGRFTKAAIGALIKNSDENKIGLEITGVPERDERSGTAEPRDQSTFYKWIVSLTTNMFLDRLHCDFSLVYNRDDAEKQTFGVTFADFINGKASIGLTPYLIYTKEEAVIVDAVLADQQSVPNLVLPPSIEKKAPRAYENADYINSKAVEGLTPYVIYRKDEAVVVDADQRSAPNVVPTPSIENKAPQLPAAYKTRLDYLMLAKPDSEAVISSVPETALHRRLAYATMRLIDLDESSVATIERIAKDPLTRAFHYHVYTLNASVHGTSIPNSIVDFYFTF
jgi:hypothetical protein